MSKEKTKAVFTCARDWHPRLCTSSPSNNWKKPALITLTDLSHEDASAFRVLYPRHVTDDDKRGCHKWQHEVWLIFVWLQLLKKKTEFVLEHPHLNNWQTNKNSPIKLKDQKNMTTQWWSTGRHFTAATQALNTSCSKLY